MAELEKQQSLTLETFKNDLTRQLAVERAFQAAVEICTDVAAHIVSIYQLGHPQESRFATLRSKSSQRNGTLSRMTICNKTALAWRTNDKHKPRRACDAHTCAGRQLPFPGWLE